MRRDPALSFWMDYVSQEGGLVEEGEDGALALLPTRVREETGLPEEVLVTSDPEYAEEANALLLIPGHPVLETAAGRVLEQGDAGWRRLRWPRPSSLPDGERLLRLSRDHVDVEHGRIDLAGVPASVYLPALRVGALVTYTVDEPFQEREEVWVDAHTCLPLDKAFVAAPSDLGPAEDGAGQHSCLRPDLGGALRAAHEEVERRATKRLQVLARQAAPQAADELRRAEAYFEGALLSIAQRRDRAPAERQRLYDSQADATRAERIRRRHEIEEKFRPRSEVRPFRLHLLLLPALHVPLMVRRGRQAFPFVLTWIPAAGAFVPYRCPACGRSARLVAGRERLGCASCLARPATAAAPSAPQPQPGAPPPVPEPPPASPQRRSPTAGQSKGRMRASARQVPDRDVDRDEELDLAGRVARLERDRARVIRAGDQLSIDFWQRVLDRRPWRRIPAGSPLALLYELYGPAGPLLAVGMPRGESPEEVIGGTASVDFQLRAVTAGELVTTSGRWDFALLWRLVDGRPWVTEALPSAEDPLGGVPDLGELPADVQANLRRPPRPNVRLDPLEGLVWKVETGRRGLPLAVRGLAAWRSVRAQTDVSGFGTEAVAAAVASAVARDSGLRLRREEFATEYGAEANAVARAVRRLQPALHSAWR